MLDKAIINELNEDVRNEIASYYKTRSAENFFNIDAMLRFCMKHELTVEEVPQLIEMKNIIVMG